LETKFDFCNKKVVDKIYGEMYQSNQSGDSGFNEPSCFGCFLWVLKFFNYVWQFGKMENFIKRFKCFRMAKLILDLFVFAALVWVSGGCAIHYYNPKTGTENLWGFGHLKMATHPSDEGVSAVVKGTQTLGLGLGFGRTDCYVTAGWNNQRDITVSDNASVRFEWPTADFFNIRVGTNFPTAYSSTNNSGKK
jgi:hypothetical protein